MNERRSLILELVIETYIRSAHPIASAMIADYFNISSATVRNEFSALEEAGYLQQPHTSAGRMPTAYGYEYYARKFIPPGRLSIKQRSLLRQSLKGVHGDILLQRVAKVTADLSGYAVVVSLASNDNLNALEIHLSALSSSHILAVIVLENGLIRQLAVELDPAPADQILRDAESDLRNLTLPLGQIPGALIDLAKHSNKELARTLLALANTWPNMTPPKLFSQGIQNLFSEPEANNPNFLRTVVERVEQPDPMASPEALMIILDNDLAQIGARLNLGQSQGQLILLGPTRMRYPEALMIAQGVTETVAAFMLS